MPAYCAEIVAFLDNCLQTERYPPTERGGVFRPSDRMVNRMGLTLEPFPDLSVWVRENKLDALWLHRPWKIRLDELPADRLILAHHLPFDETLTTGYNTRLAAALCLQHLEPLGFKQALTDSEPLPPRAIGMIGETEKRSLDDWCRLAEREMGGYDALHRGANPLPGRVAVVGAMTDALVREAADRGAGLYLTGQFRPPARKAVGETGLSVLTLGHRRTELWGLRTLGAVLQERWPDLGIYCWGDSH